MKAHWFLGSWRGTQKLRTLPHQSLPANDKPLIKDLEELCVGSRQRTSDDLQPNCMLGPTALLADARVVVHSPYTSFLVDTILSFCFNKFIPPSALL
ncbi:hypothetical protein IMY05_015G0059700 [Salix suchowensis]|nr:hypothetical protein IMY05_015G0059700 [Salix suchowensis]